MQYLDAYHLGYADTEAAREERIRQDKTCMACGHYDGDHTSHECPGYPSDAR